MYCSLKQKKGGRSMCNRDIQISVYIYLLLQLKVVIILFVISLFTFVTSLIKIACHSSFVIHCHFAQMCGVYS